METMFFQVWVFKDGKPHKPSNNFGKSFSVETLANVELKKARKAFKNSEYKTCQLTIKPLKK